VQSRHQVLLGGRWAEDPDVGVGNAGRAQALGDRFGGGRGAAVLVGGVDLDQLAKDVQRRPALGGRRRRRWW